MSARMASFTGEQKWAERYFETVTKLDDTLDEAVKIYPDGEQIITRISNANELLVASEKRSLQLAKLGFLKDAQLLLTNFSYEENKATYLSGLNELVDELGSIQRQHQHAFDRLFVATLIVFLILIAALGFIIWQMHNVIVQRLEIENTLAVVAKRLLSPHISSLDQEVNSALHLIASKANADYASIIVTPKCNYAQPEMMWTATHGINRPSLENALQQLVAEDAGQEMFEPTKALKEMGYTNVLASTVSDSEERNYHLCLVSHNKRSLSWGFGDTATLSRFAELILRAVDACHKTEQLRLLADKDHLTNLYNRRKFMEAMEQEWQRYQLSSAPSAALMLDIDKFKVINDTYGHAVGDKVLQRVAQIMRAAVRNIDTVGRLGGEEFSILLPTITLNDAIDIAEHIRIQIQNTPISVQNVSLSLTMSIGVAEFTSEDDSVSTIMNRADKALYLAKQNGRNRVIQSSIKSAQMSRA
jgi:diguanylate cyclase (GGDEF)-like protein